MEFSSHFHGSTLASKETSMEVGGNRFTSMEFSPWKLVKVDLLPWKLVEASMEIHGRFYCRWQCKPPLLPSIATSTNIFRRSFHEVPYTPTYFHLLPRVSQSSSCFHKTNPNLKLELPPWKRAYFQLPRKNMEVHGSSTLLPWK